jgi:hypothetical protein
MATYKSISGLAGVNLDRLDTEPQFALGTEVKDSGGRTWQYVQSNTAITVGDCVHVNSSTVAAAITAALAITPGRIGFAEATAFTTSTYGWVVVNGPVSVRVAANTNKDVPLYTSDTAGVLDDATASLSHHQIQGVYLVASSGTNVVTRAAGVANYPLVRRPAV